MVKRSFWVCFLFLGLACGNSNNGAAAKSRNSSSSAAETASASVIILQDGKTIASYQCRNPDAILDADKLMIELNSPDRKYAFMGYVGSSKSGNYALAATQQRGKAAIDIFHEGSDLPARLTPAAGNFTLSSINGKQCSGHFSGTLKDAKDRSYSISGNFSNVPIRNIQAGK